MHTWPLVNSASSMVKCTLLLLALSSACEARVLRQVCRVVGSLCVATLPFAHMDLASPVVAVHAAPIASEYYNKAENAIESTQRKFKAMDQAWDTAKKTLTENERVRT